VLPLGNLIIRSYTDLLMETLVLALVLRMGVL
jgi:hypothetical protein